MNRERDVPANESSGNPIALLVITIGLIMLLAGGFYIWKQQHSIPLPEVMPIPISLQVEQAPIEMPVAVEEEEVPVFEALPERKIILPPDTLDGSDLFVRKAITDLAPIFLDWLIGSQQIRKWVLTIDLLADGNLLKQDRPLKYPMERYQAVSSGEDIYVPADLNYSRTNLLMNAVTAINPDALVYYYQKWSPLLEKGYQELGKRGTFHGRLVKALDRFIAVQPLSIEPLLEKKGGVMYRFVDASLESATDVEKLMWRFGADNSEKLQTYLKQVKDKLPK